MVLVTFGLKPTHAPPLTEPRTMHTDPYTTGCPSHLLSPEKCHTAERAAKIAEVRERPPAARHLAPVAMIREAPAASPGLQRPLKRSESNSAGER